MRQVGYVLVAGTALMAIAMLLATPSWLAVRRGVAINQLGDAESVSQDVARTAIDDFHREVAGALLQLSLLPLAMLLGAIMIKCGKQKNQKRLEHVGPVNR